MPRGCRGDQHLNKYFGFDRKEYIPLNFGIFPPPTSKVLENGPGWSVCEDELGAITKAWTDREIGMSQHIRYPVHDRETWEALKRRLDPDAAVRYPEYWDELKRSYRDRDYVLAIEAGSYYGWIRNWVGVENLSLMYYDCPDLVHEMTEFCADFTLKVMERALDEVPDIDYAAIWEDMAMKTGPLISPKLFREFMMEPLKRVTKVLNQAGIDIILVDCDGNIDALLPLWLEAGVNLHFPLEVAASCDPLAYRKQYGQGPAHDRRHRQACPARLLHEGGDRAGGHVQGARAGQAGRLRTVCRSLRSAGRLLRELQVLHGVDPGRVHVGVEQEENRRGTGDHAVGASGARPSYT